MTQTVNQFRAVVYENIGNGVRLLRDYSEVTNNISDACEFAEEMKRKLPNNRYWVCVVSKLTSPHNFLEEIMTQNVECRACKGSGTASASRDYVRRETIQEYCRICHGRGVIEKFTAEQMLELAREQAKKQDLL